MRKGFGPTVAQRRIGFRFASSGLGQRINRGALTRGTELLRSDVGSNGRVGVGVLCTCGSVCSLGLSRWMLNRIGQCGYLFLLARGVWTFLMAGDGARTQVRSRLVKGRWCASLSTDVRCLPSNWAVCWPGRRPSEDTVIGTGHQ